MKRKAKLLSFMTALMATSSLPYLLGNQFEAPEIKRYKAIHKKHDLTLPRSLRSI